MSVALFLFWVIQFALVANRKYANLIACWNKTIERDVAGMAVRDHQLAQLAAYFPTDQWMTRKYIDSFADYAGRRGSCDPIAFG